MDDIIINDFITRSAPIKGIGHKLLIQRIRRKITRPMLAKVTGLTLERITSIELCEIEPTKEEIQIIFDGFITAKPTHEFRQYKNQQGETK